jgi:uncharacterized protein (TIGR02186 family)
VTMRQRLFLPLAVLLSGHALAGPTLVPEVSQREIEIQYSFAGAKLLLFGAIVGQEGGANSNPIDIAVVVKGPSRSALVREKQKWLGVWVNAESNRFRSLPGFYAIASSRPISKIVDSKTAAIFELGLNSLQLSPAGESDVATQRRFNAGLRALMEKKGQFAERGNSVEIRQNALYLATISIPAQVPTGAYTAETFLIRDGKVLAAATRPITIRKTGFEKFVADAAKEQPVIYGLFATMLALSLGWLAGVLFRKL